jgi:hypothetical protein
MVVLPIMKKADVTCPDCSAGYRRIELTFKAGSAGTYRCLFAPASLKCSTAKRTSPIGSPCSPKRYLASRAGRLTSNCQNRWLRCCHPDGGDTRHGFLPHLLPAYGDPIAPWRGIFLRSSQPVFQALLNGAARDGMSCQFGTMFTEPE